MRDQILATAKFNPKVKTYWILTVVLISALTLVGLLALPVILALGWWICGKILDAMSATLTTRKLVVCKGVLFTVEKSIPLEKITDVALSQGPLMRLLGLYRLSFETAGQSGHGALVSMVGIEEPAAFREAILNQKDALANQAKNSSGLTSPETPVDQPPGLEELAKSVKNIEALLEQLVKQRS